MIHRCESCNSPIEDWINILEPKYDDLCSLCIFIVANSLEELTDNAQEDGFYDIDDEDD